jgi:hypothetical protein
MPMNMSRLNGRKQKPNKAKEHPMRACEIHAIARQVLRQHRCSLFCCRVKDRENVKHALSTFSSRSLNFLFGLTKENDDAPLAPFECASGI